MGGGVKVETVPPHTCFFSSSFFKGRKDNVTGVVFQEGEDIMRMKPETREQIEPMLSDLNKQWEDLETTTKEKGEKLFDANRSVLYEQSCDDIDGWVTALESQIITSEDFGKDLTTVNLQVQKQNVSGTYGFGVLSCDSWF